MGKKTPSRRQVIRPIVNTPEEDRARDIGKKEKMVKIARVVPEISSRTDRQIDPQTDILIETLLNCSCNSNSLTKS